MEKTKKITVTICILFVIACLAYLVTQEANASEISKTEQPVKLYYFGIDNCFACTLQKPIIVRLNTRGFNFEIIDATRPTPEVQVLLDKYSITSYPTIIIITAEDKVVRIVGFRPLSIIKRALK